jgi:hypothetical protein
MNDSSQSLLSKQGSKDLVQGFTWCPRKLAIKKRWNVKCEITNKKREKLTKMEKSSKA